MQQSEPDAPHPPTPRTALRPLKVLLCPDQPNWAFDNIAVNIERHAGAHRLSKLYMSDVAEDPGRLFATILSRGIDVCHVFWREDMFRLFQGETLKAVAASLGMEHAEFVRAIANVAFTTSVYDHLFTADREMEQRRWGFAAIDGYTVSSARLDRIYKARPDLPAPDAVIEDGVDTYHFCPRDDVRRRDRFTVGWAGNSAWGHNSQGYDVKGFTRVFQPMVARLNAAGHDIQTRIADPTIKRIPFAEMPDFYRSLDVFVCTSAIEGTPNPVLEAMACGVPVVSSDVGIVPDVFGPAQSDFIIDPPDPELFADAIARLIGTPALQETLRHENRARMQNQTWSETTKGWWPFWERCVHRAIEPRGSGRREHWMLQAMSCG